MLKYVNIDISEHFKEFFMFKSSFSKYLTAFILVIFVSFLILSGIITFVIYNYAFSDAKERLSRECNIIVKIIEEDGVGEFKNEIENVKESIQTMTTLDPDYEIIITDSNGNIVLSTLHNDNKNEPKLDFNGITNIDLSSYNIQMETGSNDEVGYIYNGTIQGSKEKYMGYARAIEYGNSDKFFVLALRSTEKEYNLVSVTRQAVINSSIPVMIAAVVASYFITNRIVKPLKIMTDAAKSFAEGDFSSRVEVSERNHEVAELAVAFNNMADSLDSLEKMRNSFLANVSHDLRTPMTTISGFIDGITSGAIPEDKHEYYLGIISNEIHRLSRLVTQLLDISRLESGERKFDYVDFDIAEMARIILISFEQKIEDKRLDVEFDAEFDGMYARADKDAIYQVLYNLCHNAIKFAADGGKFRISIIKITDTKLKICVYDQGQGIDSNEVNMVFDRFYKTDKSRGLDKNGVGLGLYICKTIIDAHGETIGVEAGENDCEFWFTVTEGAQPQKRKQIADTQ